jgi:hypothetical protein
MIEILIKKLLFSIDLFIYPRSFDGFQVSAGSLND